MSGQLLLHTVFSFLPFVVCLFWLIVYLVNIRKNDAPKHFVTGYLATCVVLYLCHALYFTIGIPYEMECLWTLCSLSVYPLFYGYLCRLTSNEYNMRKLLPWLLPGLLVAIAKYALPDAGMDRLRLGLFVVQIVTVCYLGTRMLRAFDNKLQTVYADTESRDTTAVHQLLIAIITVSVLAGIANSIGKQFFGESLWMLIPISIAFSTMQFTLSYICFYRDFTVDQLSLDERDGDDAVIANADGAGDAVEVLEDDELIGRKLEELMIERHYYLKHDLKIGEVVKEIGSNRTYVSNYINRTYLCSFSDYMNRLRVEYAKQLIQSSPKDTKLSIIAERSGFASEQSFYRNFKKFTNLTPAQWLNSQK